jgi:glucan-binding YG repeat protein
MTDITIFGTPIESILLETGKQYYFTLDSVNLELWDGWIDGDVWYYVKKLSMPLT